MKSSSTGHGKFVAAIVFGLIPCVIGLGVGQYLRWTDAVWLTSAGSFWPIVFVVTSIAALLKRAVSPFEDNIVAIAAWLVLAWTWLDLPLWLTAMEIPQSSAIVGRDGRVLLASQWARQVEDKVWLLTGRAGSGNRIVRNAAGTVTIHAVDVGYRFAVPYIATGRDGDDMAQPLIAAMTIALGVEAGKSRTSRIALFQTTAVQDQFLRQVCRDAIPDAIACPLTIRLSPRVDATAPGAVWAKAHTEAEALTEKHVPTLVRLLTEENSKLVERDRVFALVMDLADKPEDLSRVAQNSRLLDDPQFDGLIRRTLVMPGAGNEAVSIVVRVNRLTQDQRRDLRVKALGEAAIGVMCHHAAALRLTDSEVVQLAVRMPATFATNPQIAALALETFGERLPAEARHDAVKAIVGASASLALAALRHLNFSTRLRGELLRKVVADATVEDLVAANLGREKLEDMLTPAELRVLIASAVEKSERSSKWLDFAVRSLPLRKLTIAERKSVLTGLLFARGRSALEFASENRQFLDPADVAEITTDYTRTIAPDLCLHLSHRNTSRQIDYFSEAQVQIFRACARGKHGAQD